VIKDKIWMIIRIAVLVFLVGCSPVKYSDVSSDQKFKNLIGVEITTRKELLAFGVTFDANYKKNVDYVFILPIPGISGPEVVFKEVVAKGSTLKVEGVLEQNNLFGNRYLYKINILNTDFLSEYTVVLKMSKSTNTENMGVSSELYKILERKDD
jgi:hypothetical protein